MSSSRMARARTLVVGAGHAGVQVAASLRDLGDRGSITLIGAEPHLPYQRPPLSKTFLSGAIGAHELVLRSPSFFAASAIDLISGDPLDNLTLSSNGAPGSGIATTVSGRSLQFDRLALAVGGRPRPLLVPGHDLEGICYLRNLDDAVRFRSLMGQARNIVIVGGGFIGLETASVARSAGKHVTVVEAADRVLARVVAPVVSEFYQRAHARRGTQIRLSAGVVGFVGGGGKVSGVQLTDGSEIAADLVLVGIGLIPRTQLARSIGLACDDGIVVDAYARTSKPSIVAAGDCTAAAHVRSSSAPVRLESVQNAVAQGRIAASSLLGRVEQAVTVPWFWSDQDDLKLQIAGVNAGYDHCVVRGIPDSEKFSVLYYRGDQLLAVDAINASRDYMAVRKALGQLGNIPPERVADTSIELVDLMSVSRQPSSA